MFPVHSFWVMLATGSLTPANPSAAASTSEKKNTEAQFPAHCFCQIVRDSPHIAQGSLITKTVPIRGVFFFFFFFLNWIGHIAELKKITTYKETRLTVECNARMWRPHKQWAENVAKRTRIAKKFVDCGVYVCVCM